MWEILIRKGICSMIYWEAAGACQKKPVMSVMAVESELVQQIDFDNIVQDLSSLQAQKKLII